MINVSEATKTAYRVSTPKDIILNFPNYNDNEGLVIHTGNLGLESFELTQILEKEKFLTFTGCNATQLKVTIARMPVELKGQYVEASIQAGETDVIPLFKGYVDSQVIKDYATSTSDLVAYDILYTLSNKNIAQWYIHLWENIEDISLKDFRDSLFEYLDLSVASVVLPNDDLIFTKQYSPVQMKALDVIRAICQINGVYGLINRYGIFEFRVLPKITGTNYPVVPKYKTIEYQRWSVVGITKVTVRQSEDVEGGSYGIGSNVYIVQGNIFTLNLEDSVLSGIAEKIYPNVEGRIYVPYTAGVQGYPWVEVGDVQTYKIYDFTNASYVDAPFYVINRVLKGIQALFDTQSAEGEEYRTVFVSNLATKIDTIKDQIEEMSGKLNSLSLKYVMFYNERAIDIGDGEIKTIASNEFAVAQPSQVRIELEYLLECFTTETENNNIIVNNDLKVKLLYEYDGTFIDSRQPIETYQDGKHILKAYYVLDIPDKQAHSWRVFLQCEDGSVHIDVLQAQNTIFGLGTLVGDLWDGQIRADDDIDAVTFGLFIPSAIGESVSFEQHTPSVNNITTVIPAITFGDITRSYTDSVSIDDDYFLVWAYDWLSTYTCNVVDGIWSGAGNVTTVDITLSSVSNTVVADSSNDVTYAVSFDSGNTWYGWTGSAWQEDFEMALSTFNSIPSFLDTTIIIRATLISVSTLKDIKIYGGTI